MHELPSGTITFLFTDIEGSTRLLHEPGAGYAEMLAGHRRTLRDAFVSHDGVEVDTQGDAFFVAFARASDALAAARDGQSGLGGGPIRVRMGLHTGEPLVTDEGYVGVDVHRAARIAAAGHGGQVLVSQATRDLAVDADLRDLGEYRLKDLSAPERLWQLGEEDFPRLKTLFQTNLPIPATPFLGRERELAAVDELIRGNRLVTLTGPGGSGKTRLALQAAGAAADVFDKGVWWVPLAPLRDASLVLGTAGSAIEATADLAEHIGNRRMLLLFDNFEHVIEAASELALLLARCPGLGVLVTSREPLRLDGEWEYAVDPLREREAIELFETRARAARSDFAANGEVREICARLDNLPLAIELAAARAKVLSPSALLERLERRLPVLTSGTRDAPERQRTLRATIEWSHDLLADGERTLFRRLSVFAGGCTLEAAEAVCDADLDTLASLVDKSLVRQNEDRFWMLETIREYASERLEESGESEVIKRRHAENFLALAESANLYVEAQGNDRVEIVIPEQANLGAAIEWTLEEGDIELGLRLAVALEQYWVSNSPEGRRWLSELLDRGGDVPPQLHAQAVRALGGVIYITGDFDEGTRYHEQALAEFRELGDEFGIGHLLFRSAVEAHRVGDSALARRLCDESRVIHGGRSNWAESQATSLLGILAFEDGRHEEAFELLDRSATLAEEAGFRWWRTNSLLTAAEYALMLERSPDQAREPALEALAIANDLGNRQNVVYGLAIVAWAAVAGGQPERGGRLWGAIEAEEERAHIGQWESQRELYVEHFVDGGGPEFERGRTAGRSLSLADAVEYALAPVD